jgi:methyl-accepting chemotaxis protein
MKTNGASVGVRVGAGFVALLVFLLLLLISTTLLATSARNGFRDLSLEAGKRQQLADTMLSAELAMQHLPAAADGAARRYVQARRALGEAVGTGLDAAARAQDPSSVLLQKIDQAQPGERAQPLRAFLNAQDQLRKQAANDWLAGINSIFTKVAAFVALLIGASAVTVLWLSRSLTGPLRAAAGVAQQIADGQLGVALEVDGSGELGRLQQAVLDMSEALAKTVSQVRIAADTLVISSREIATGNSDLSQRTEADARALDDASASMAELARTVERNAQSIHEAGQLVREAAALAEHGGIVVAGVVARMESIRESSRRVGEITGLIDAIAFQTNILALNAAVEAARAGEQGRAFAVVANEVRVLAQRSASAAHDIKDLVLASVGQVDQGSALVAQAGKTMTDIAQAVDHVNGIMAGIDEAGQLQNVGIREVSAAVAQMDEMTQQNAALVEQSAATAMQMQDEAQGLAAAVHRFRFN